MTTGDPTPYESPRRHQDPAGASTGARPKPGGFRRFLPLLMAGWAILEVWLLIQLAGVIGAFGVFLVLLAGFVLGAVVIKQAGRRAWHNLIEALQPPGSTGVVGQGSADKSRRGGNALAMLGGLLLMLPGIASDVLGLLCVFPPTAALLRKVAGRSLAGSGLADAVQQARTAQERARMHNPDGKVVPGEVIREDADRGGPEAAGPRDRRPGDEEGGFRP